MSETFRFNRMELAGSLGDLGALLPIAIAMVLINGLDPLGLFLSIGIFFIFSGIYFGVTVPVQPMTDLSREYFGEPSKKVTNRAACISMALANFMSFFLGGMPLCRGAGGLAAHYRFDGTEYYDIRVLVPEKHLNSRLDVENLIIKSSRDDPIRLRDIAGVAAASGPVEIIRENQIKQITVEADMVDGDLAGGVNALRGALAQIDRPAGYGFSFGGNAEMMADMKDTVIAVLAFALFFSFIVLTVQFNSVKLPALILSYVPVCLAGSVFVMHASGLPLGATVIIGVLVVVAATVNDGVLLLTYAGDMLQPMAVAAIGGLGMEILVALFLMPCMYVAVRP